ncbi:type VII secretion integral membrane protein EccD [Streptomyces sp. NRRL S-1868]|uniref:type VII secretion integral membrane protein EccD n=1 Tax=Streptomyces sp. NRRL S-1868 TaxID=1463892 RepID=UPI000AE3C94E|nr:type VII secretion integral membrane protein EccD [Streptomyces sp. NRRL S-1868]
MTEDTGIVPRRARRRMWSRVTLVAPRRRADMVLPADEPLGLLLPEVLELLGDGPEGGAPQTRGLVTVQGELLTPDRTLQESGVRDGAVLRLVREAEAPPAPVVHDVSDEAAEDSDGRSGRWTAGARDVTAGVGTVALATGAAATAVEHGASPAVPVAFAGVAVVAGALAARFKDEALGATLQCTGAAIGLYVLADGPAAVWAALVAVLLALLGLTTRLGRGALVGAGALAATAMAWAALHALTGDSGRTAAVVGVLGVLALGVLPRLALAAAGLTRLDDQGAGGAELRRGSVGTALTTAHRGLALATVVLASSTALAGWLLLQAESGWATGLAALLALVAASRSRAYPLVAEVVALQAAAAFVTVRLFMHAVPQAAVAGMGGLALLPLLVLAVRAPEHLRVRLRRLLDLLEAVAIVALIPVALGLFDTYARLLETF